MKLYGIANWNEIYENSRSRCVENLSWVPIPNRHDGERYSLIWMESDACELFAAWVLILQVASKCQPRGTLLRSDGKPHDSRSLSVKTRALPRIFERALPYFANSGWLTCKEHNQQLLALDCHPGDGQPSPDRHPSAEEQNRTEGNRKYIPPAGGGVTAEEIYAFYPKKSGRRAALVQIAAAMKLRTPEQLLERTKAYAAAVGKWPPDERRFIPDPERWFKRGKYDDDPATWNRTESHGQPGGRGFSQRNDYSQYQAPAAG